MNIFRCLGLLVLLTGIPWPAIAQEEVCKFTECDHSDPGLRRTILGMAYSHDVKKEWEKSASILAKAIPLWQAPSQMIDLTSACMRLFLNLSFRQLQDEQADLLGGCPDGQMDRLYGRVDHDPIPTMRVLPFISGINRRAQRTDVVIVTFDVDKNGKVKHVKILESSNSRLNGAIRKSMRMGAYIPAFVGGVPVLSKLNKVKYTIHFDKGSVRAEIDNWTTNR